MAALTELSLFSGHGGGYSPRSISLDGEPSAMLSGTSTPLKFSKHGDDAFTFDGRPWAGLVDVVSAGFPCQPFSLAGKGLAEHDPRNGWPVVIRILREVRPRYALLENVPGLIKKNGTFVTHSGGKLNPTWVEWLMGWPLGWTDLKVLEMDKFQQWLQKHGVGMGVVE